MTDDATRAFVPGHVTGFFSVERADDPTKTGSRGAGLALSDGVTVAVEPTTDESTIWLDGSTIEMDAVETVLDALGVRATVRAETDLPLGSGFGVSGAMALGTALAANEAFGRALSENELVTVAHGAEVQAGSGLGDVVAQSRGGAAIRLEPGGPQHNTLDGIPARRRVEYCTFGELATADVITGDTETLSAAGERALSSLVGDPTMETFMTASRRFAREAGILTPGIRSVVEDVADAGGTASMAMLGETVFALGSGLSDAGYDAAVCEIDPAGARLRPE
ncbi:pantoate kinase [Haloarculaceae archaeon H-GB1-1]|nr:pantoate kinase [Haloarculaceae archaeon H-GB1-1]